MQREGRGACVLLKLRSRTANAVMWSWMKMTDLLSRLSAISHTSTALAQLVRPFAPMRTPSNTTGDTSPSSTSIGNRSHWVISRLSDGL